MIFFNLQYAKRNGNAHENNFYYSKYLNAQIIEKYLIQMGMKHRKQKTELNGFLL